MKSRDGYKQICSVWRPGAFAARSQGKPKWRKIAGGSNVCLSSCSSITKYARIMTLAPFERLKVTDSSNYSFEAMYEPLKFGNTTEIAGV